MKKLYQNVKLPGFQYESETRKDSKFWNEGKWDTFIKPLLPKDGGTFIELGSSAGLFLKKAEEAGFRKVIGVEANRHRIKEAKLYREKNGGSYEIVDGKLCKDFDVYSLPLADVILISNTHYYLDINGFIRLVDQLRTRCRFLIIVSVDRKTRVQKANSELKGIRRYFRDYKEDGRVKRIDPTGDPEPRPTMFSVRFEGALKQYDVKKIFENFYNHRVKKTVFGDEYKPINGKLLPMWEYWHSRQRNRSNGWQEKKLKQATELIKDIKKRGLFKPIIIHKRTDVIEDGINRLFSYYYLGYKKILARKI